MAWTAKNLEDVPQIIAGPILRKVTPTSVSVFLVVKTDIAIELRVYKPNDPNPVLQAGSITPCQIGDSLYALTITAEAGTQPPLEQGVVYGYNLYFGDDHLGTENILATGIGPILNIVYPVAGNSYDIGDTTTPLPTFILPPLDPNELWILHGSCRKPHGEQYDAMQGIDKVIYDAVLSSTPEKRPQMLCLTGDQIYADDVAPQMLHMLMKTADNFIGWKEKLYDEDTQTVSNPEINNAINNNDYNIKNLFLPANRSTYILHEAKMTSERKVCGSHLIQFAEFAMMYLFVWSDVLWPDDLPEWDDVMIKYDVNDVPHVVGKTKQTTKIKIVASPLTLGLPILVPVVETVPTEEYNNFHNIHIELTRFKSTLKDIRRMLANIPVYMILDDHEVTDDLFYNHEWNEHVMGNTIPLQPSPVNVAGRRILRNGMAAYAIFQAWGNTPEQFVSGHAGKTLLDSIGTVADTLTMTPIAAATIETIVLPEFINQYNAIPGAYQDLWFNVSKHNINDFIMWNYRYTFTGLPFEIIFLDTRTYRGYPKGFKGHAALIYDSAMKGLQVTDAAWPDKKDLTIVVSAAPVLGYKQADKLVRLVSHKYDMKEVVPQQYYVTGPTDKELFPFQIQKPFDKDIPNQSVENSLDAEQWSQDLPMLYALLSSLAKRAKLGQHKHRIVILSGDVHYSFTKRLEMFAKNLYNEPDLDFQFVIASLTASSFKNETMVTRNVSTVKVAEDDYFAFGKNNYPGDLVESQITHVKSKSAPAIDVVFDLPSDYSSATLGWDWMHRTVVIRDPYRIDSLYYAEGQTFPEAELVMRKHHEFVKSSGERSNTPTCGTNCFGEVRLVWQPNYKEVHHIIYNRQTSDSAGMQPIRKFVGHSLDLNIHDDPNEW